MSRKKPVALVIGLVACAAVGWSIYQLALAVDCGTATGVECPSDWIIAPLAVGLTVAILTTFFGGKLVFFGIFLGPGIGALAGGFQVNDPDGRLTFLIIGGVFTLVGLLPFLLLPFNQAKRRKAQRLLEHGVPAIGTITAVTDTGVTVNMNPRVELTVRIEPQDGSSTFEGKKTIIASRINLPYVGQRYPVWFDREDRTTFMLASDVQPDASPEVRRLFALAQSGDPRQADAASAAASAFASSGGFGRASGSDVFGAADTPGESGGATTDPLERLAKLNELRQAGALTEAEFEAQKAKLLGTG